MDIDFGYSPCPNDTFMFWAWAHGRLASDLTLVPHLHDIQELNRLALERGELALTKLSMATYLEPQIQARYRLLSAGAALGRGCGPLVVSQTPWPSSQPKPLKLAIPGRNTTACKLTQMAVGSRVTEWVELRYDEILPAVVQGRVDAGVIIHESRFVYQELGLTCAFDLGDWWEKETGLPLPLGVMVAQRELSEETVAEVERNLQESIAAAQGVLGGPQTDESTNSLWNYLRSNAIELEDTTMSAHIELYVNEYSLELGTEGRAAIAAFEERAS